MKNFLWSKSWDSLINRAELGLRNWSPWGNGFTTEGNKWLTAPSWGSGLFLNGLIKNSDCPCLGVGAHTTDLKVYFYAIPTAHIEPFKSSSWHLMKPCISFCEMHLTLLLESLAYTFLVGKQPELKGSFAFCLLGVELHSKILICRKEKEVVSKDGSL